MHGPMDVKKRFRPSCCDTLIVIYILPSNINIFIINKNSCYMFRPIRPPLGLNVHNLKQSGMF